MTNWKNEALDFLLNLYPVKEEKDIALIRSTTTNLLKKHAHANAAALIRLEDEITARILFSTIRQSSTFFNADVASRIINTNKIEISEATPSNLFDGINILFPVVKGSFSGLFIIAIDAIPNEEYKQFLEDIWIGLKDITMLVQTYYSFEHLNTRFNAILGTIDQAVVFIDDIGRDGWINSAASKLLNVDEGRNPSITIAGAMQQLRTSAVNANEIEQEGAKLFNLPGQIIKDWKWIYGNPVSLVLSVSCVPTISENVKGRLWVFTDITAIHLATEQLKELNTELAEKRKIADEQNKAKSDFLANMSHEIRTPMNGVIGMTSLLAGTNLDEEQKDYVDTIRISGESLLSIINDILDFSKIESGKMELEHEPFRLSSVIEETYDLLSVKANEKGLDLLYYIEPDVPDEILGDVVRFRQILINLVSNGLKFTEKGEILITVQNMETKGDDCIVNITVKDTGIGIPKEKFYKLFESFSQVDSSTTRRYGGTGLGLAISQRLVSLMGGAINVESEEGKGSAFTFTIKARIAAPNATNKSKEIITNDALLGKSILILDDNNTNLKILSKQSGLWGMKPRTFNSYTDAIDELKKQHFDIALIDMLMPDSNGIEVAGLIKQINDKLPIVLFSSAGYFTNNDEIKQLFKAVINKPAKQEYIKSTLVNILKESAGEWEVSQNNEPAANTVLPINILVAEDDEINQKLIQKALSKLGYQPDIVSNGYQAVAKEREKNYQLIFMDVMMPEMDGYEATKIISSNHTEQSRPVIIALTANALTGDKENIIAAGMDDYISKPYKIQDIKKILDKWTPKLLKSSSSPKKYEHINLEYITELADGEKDFMLEIITNYLDTVSPSIQNLQKAIDNRNTEEVVLLAHKLKGSFRFIGCEALGNIMEKIENNISQENQDIIAALMNDVKNKYIQTEMELQLVMKDISNETLDGSVHGQS